MHPQTRCPCVMMLLQDVTLRNSIPEIYLSCHGGSGGGEALNTQVINRAQLSMQTLDSLVSLPGGEADCARINSSLDKVSVLKLSQPRHWHIMQQNSTGRDLLSFLGRFL